MALAGGCYISQACGRDRLWVIQSPIVRVRKAAKGMIGRWHLHLGGTTPLPSQKRPLCATRGCAVLTVRRSGSPQRDALPSGPGSWRWRGLPEHVSKHESTALQHPLV